MCYHHVWLCVSTLGWILRSAIKMVVMSSESLERKEDGVLEVQQSSPNSTNVDCQYSLLS